MAKPTLLVYKTHDGTSSTLSRLHFDSLLDLNLACGRALRIPPDAVIAFFSNGEQIREENVVEAGSEGKNEVYVFSREILQSDPQTVINSLLLQPSLPAPSKNPTLSHLSLLLPSIPPLLQSLKIQHRSLTLATLNLTHHLSVLSSTYSTALVPFAVAEFERQRKLLVEYEVWMWVVGKVKVSEKIVGASSSSSSSSRKAEKEKGRESTGGTNERTLGNYISKEKMGLVKEKAEAAFVELEARFQDVKVTVEGLQAGSEEVSSVVAGFTCEEAEECGRVAERALERAKEIERNSAGGGSVEEDGFREMRDLDLLIRQKIELLLEIKNAFSSHLINTLHRISDLQSTIAHLPPILSNLETDLRSPPGFNHIFRFSIMPHAYGRLLVEGARRREFVAFYLSRSSSLAETLAKMISSERKRRLAYKQDVEAQQLPFSMGSAMDGTPPTTEVNNVGGVSEEAFGLERKDVEEYLDLLSAFEKDPELLELVGEGGWNPVTELRTTLLKYVEKMDRLVPDFDKMAEKTLMSGSRLSRSRRTSTVDLVALQAAHDRTETLEQESVAQTSTIRDLQTTVTQLQSDLSTLTSNLDTSHTRSHHLEAELASLRSQRVAELETLDRIKATSESQIADLSKERSTLLRELAQSRMKVQDLDVQLAGSRAQVRTTNAALLESRKEQERVMKEQVEEAGRLLRDHLAEADGDRAVLEHQIADSQANFDKLKIDSETSLKAIKDKSTREIDGVKAELKLQKAQLREAQSQRTLAVEETGKVTSAAAVREQDLETLFLEAVQVAKSFKEVDERLLDTVRSSSLGSSLSLGSSTLNPPPPPPSDATVVLGSSPQERMARQTLGVLVGYDLRAFEDMVLKTFRLVKKWQQKYSEHRDKARDKIAVSHFSPGDVALFLPTRNFTAALRPWAAFNVNFPHYFLQTSQELADHLLTREYYLARVASITERTVDPKSLNSSTNVGLPVGSTYFIVETDVFSPTPIKPRSRRTSSMTGAGSSPVPRSSMGRRTASSILPGTPESPLVSPTVTPRNPGRRETPGSVGLAMPMEGDGGGYFASSDSDASSSFPPNGNGILNSSSPPTHSSLSHILPLNNSSTSPPPPLIDSPTSPSITQPPTSPTSHLSPPASVPAPLPTSRRPSTSHHPDPHSHSHSSAQPIPFTRSHRPSSVASSNSSHPGSLLPGSFRGLGFQSKASATIASSTVDVVASALTMSMEGGTAAGGGDAEATLRRKPSGLGVGGDGNGP